MIRIDVSALPEEDPLITGEEKVYASGDVLALNCTSGKSFPPAQLKWYINGVPVRFSSFFNYSLILTYTAYTV